MRFHIPIRLIPDGTNLPFMKWARIRTPISLFLIVLSFVLFFTVGVNEGIDFKGGTVIEIKSHQPAADLADIRSQGRWARPRRRADPGRRRCGERAHPRCRPARWRGGAAGEVVTKVQSVAQHGGL